MLPVPRPPIGFERAQRLGRFSASLLLPMKQESETRIAPVRKLILRFFDR